MSSAAITSFDKRSGLAFIVAFGIVSLFADMAYEGMRSVSGPCGVSAVLCTRGCMIGLLRSPLW